MSCSILMQGNTAARQLAQSQQSAARALLDAKRSQALTRRHIEIAEEQRSIAAQHLVESRLAAARTDRYQLSMWLDSDTGRRYQAWRAVAIPRLSVLEGRNSAWREAIVQDALTTLAPEDWPRNDGVTRVVRFLVESRRGALGAAACVALWGALGNHGLLLLLGLLLVGATVAMPRWYASQERASAARRRAQCGYDPFETAEQPAWGGLTTGYDAFTQARHIRRVLDDAGRSFPGEKDLPPLMLPTPKTGFSNSMHDLATTFAQSPAEL